MRTHQYNVANKRKNHKNRIYLLGGEARRNQKARLTFHCWAKFCCHDISEIYMYQRHSVCEINSGNNPSKEMLSNCTRGGEKWGGQLMILIGRETTHGRYFSQWSWCQYWPTLKLPMIANQPISQIIKPLMKIYHMQHGSLLPSSIKRNKDNSSGRSLKAVKHLALMRQI